MLNPPLPVVLLVTSIVLAPAAYAAAPENGNASDPAQEATSAEDDGSTLQQRLRQPSKTEGLQKPGAAEKRNLGETQPALVNPCRTSPAPSWCGEQ